jgi:hypothetical protein
MQTELMMQHSLLHAFYCHKRPVKSTIFLIWCGGLIGVQGLNNSNQVQISLVLDCDNSGLKFAKCFDDPIIKHCTVTNGPFQTGLLVKTLH